MITNQLYPYIEKYINEYLYGFSKDQLAVGVMKGTILIEKVNIRIDKANEKLDSKNTPIWLKAGLIKRIEVACSIMNFIGEKPLEVKIDEIEILSSLSYRWILANENSFLEEKNEEDILAGYDPIDNNSYDIFTKKLSLFDGSFFRKKPKLIEFLKDKSKVTDMIHKFLTKVIKFYYQTNFFLSAKINKVHIRFEDDTFNYYGGSIFGLSIENIELSLSADGKLKKDSFKITNLSFYTEDVKSESNFLISSAYFLSQLYSNDEGEEKERKEKEYYAKIHQVYSEKDNPKRVALRHKIIDKFNFMGKFGMETVKSNKDDMFSISKEKSVKAYFFIATDELKLAISPNFIGKITSIQEFMKYYYLNELLQHYKPMRKPCNTNNELIRPYLKNETYAAKRKLVVRDWLFYFLIVMKYKKAVYSKPFNSKLEEEFSKYFNVCCLETLLPHPEEDNKDNNDATGTNFDKQSVANSKISKNFANIRDKERENGKTPYDENNPNPEKVNFSIQVDVSVKSLQVNIYSSHSSFIDAQDCLQLKFDKLILKFMSDCIKKADVELQIIGCHFTNIIKSTPAYISITQQVENMISGSKKIVKKQEGHSSLVDSMLHNTSSPKHKERFGFEANANENNVNDNPSKSIMIQAFFRDETHLFEEDSKKMNLAQLVKEHNKAINAKKKQTVSFQPSKETINKAKNKTEDVNLSNIPVKLELFTLQTLTFKFSKENEDSIHVNDSLNISIDSVRLNFTSKLLKQAIDVISGYEGLIRRLLTPKPKVVEKASSNLTNSLLKESQEEYEMKETLQLLRYIKKQMIDKHGLSEEILSIEESKRTAFLKAITMNEANNNEANKPKINVQLVEYFYHVNSEIATYDVSLFKEGKYKLNSLFNFLNSKRIEATFDLKTFIIGSFNDDSKLIGKLNSQAAYLKFKIAHNKIILVINDTIMEYYNLDSWKEIIEVSIITLENKILVYRSTIIEPFIEIHLKAIEESNNGDAKPRLINHISKNKLKFEEREINLNEKNPLMDR